MKDRGLCLIYTHFTGGGGDDAAADLAMRISQDRGQTWSDDRIVVRHAGGLNVMSVSLLRLANGDIALFYLHKTSKEDCRPLMCVSTDEAETWSEPTVCITDEVGYYVLNNDRAVQSTSRPYRRSCNKCGRCYNSFILSIAVSPLHSLALPAGKQSRKPGRS